MQHRNPHDHHGSGVPRSSFYDSPFGRMFGKLPPWQPPGNTQGDMERNIRLFADLMVSTDHTPALDNPEIPCGYTYFGQFIDHDITFDPTSSTVRQNDPDKLSNFRTPRLDLDSLYGAGPEAAPYLYESGTSRYGYFVIGSGESGVEPDLPRNAEGRAIIGDPRNDENIIVGQFQLAFLTLHNKVLEAIAGTARPTGAQFLEAQRIVRWFYQYVVFNDFVRRLVDDGIHQSVLEKKDDIPATTSGRTFQQWKPRRTFYKWKQAPYIPVEFSVAAYRFGHSMVRPGYQVNAANIGFRVELPVFSDPTNPSASLKGGRRLPRGFTLQWDWFLRFGADIGGGFPQPSRKIDTKLSPAMSNIPMGDGTTAPLAFLNLLRGWRMDLPSGTNVAHEMGIEPHAIGDSREDQLWFYILEETKHLGGMSGKMLGPVGGTIIAEVFAGLLAGDPLSFTSIRPRWTPADEPVLIGLGLSPTGGMNGADYELADIIALTVDSVANVPSVGQVDLTDPALIG